MREKFIVILATCPSMKEAGAITDSLLKKRLIACAGTVGGVRSRFWWKGKIENAKEVLLIMKTSRAKFLKAEREIRRLHSYDVPEVIALPISASSAPYIGWLGDAVRAGG
jgi:periplasmic divalent cation tolerance protein